jgi:hypothetical protein
MKTNTCPICGQTYLAGRLHSCALPVITGKGAEDFRRKLNEPFTEDQKEIWREADEVSRKIKSRE